MISNGIPAPSFFFFFLFFYTSSGIPSRRQKTRGFPPIGRDEDSNGMFIIPRKCDTRNCLEFYFLRSPSIEPGENVFPFVSWLAFETGQRLSKRARNSQSGSQFSSQICRLTVIRAIYRANYFAVDTIAVSTDNTRGGRRGLRTIGIH